MEDSMYRAATPGEFVLSADRGDYIQVPAGEPLEMHISKVDVTKRPVYDNPSEEEDVLSINFTLDQQIEGQGQVYRGWYRPSLNPKSKLTPLITALYGKIPETLDITEIVGMPLRIVLTEGQDKKGTGVLRQFPASFLKAAPGQKKVEVVDAMDDPAMADLFK